MIVTQVDAFDVTLAEATIITNREVSTNPRVLTLRNLSDIDIDFKIQSSPTGETGSWTDETLSDGTAQITLAPGDITVERMISGNLLRVRASGGNVSNALFIALQRAYPTHTDWTSPVV